jgi:putative membrane protein
MQPEQEEDDRGTRDPRIYMAAERTFLAWIRTGVALLAFGFVVARFGVFLRDVAGAGSPVRASGHPLWLGLALIVTGVVLIASAFRHRAYVNAIDRGAFRREFGSTFAFLVVGLLALAGAMMSVLLLRL